MPFRNVAALAFIVLALLRLRFSVVAVLALANTAGRVHPQVQDFGEQLLACVKQFAPASSSAEIAQPAAASEAAPAPRAPDIKVRANESRRWRASCTHGRVLATLLAWWGLSLPSESPCFFVQVAMCATAMQRVAILRCMHDQCDATKALLAQRVAVSRLCRRQAATRCEDAPLNADQQRALDMAMQATR
eukprot:4997747-Pleurochrysis_carterae.AAC.2